MTQGRVFLLNSASGAIVEMARPVLLGGLSQAAEYYEVTKAVSAPGTGSKRLRDKYGATIDGVLCASRPFDFALFAYATTLNTYHSRAIRVKAKDIVGRAWKITGEGTRKAQIESFFRNAFGTLTFGEGMSQVWTDYEALGNGFLEVVPTVKGEPAELAHIPATEMWIRLDGLGFVQAKNGEYSHFRAFGADVSDLPERDPLRGEGVTSVVHFSRYMPWSAYYGIPSIMPAWNRMALMTLECEYNLAFFMNNAIPDYAVILEGEWEEGADKVIEQYFRTHLKGQAHKTLTMQAPNGAKVTFEKLTSDNAKEGAFRLLRIDCRNEIVHAHGVPPQKVGIVETGALGGNLATEQLAEYKESTVEPGQEMVQARLNRIIAVGFQALDLHFEFEPYDVDDRLINSQIDGAYIDRGVLVPNEVRAVRFPDKEPLDGGDEPRRPATAGDLFGVEQALEQTQREIREAISR